MNPKKRIVVVGVGSAGILTLCHLCAWLDNEWEVVSVHDPHRKILGIGESTNPSFVETLDLGLGLKPYGEPMERLEATLKFGTRFSGWRERPFVSPLLSGSVAIHFNNFLLKDFAFERLPTRWPGKFSVLEGNLSQLTDTGDSVEFDLNGVKHRCDFLVDCSGFPSDHKDSTMSEAILVNHAFVHNVKSTEGGNFTGHLATAHGWMFTVPLATRQSHGYLFNKDLVSVEEARRDFSRTINVPEKELEGIEYSFRSYYSNKVFDGRIIRNGNAALFFEPIGATSIYSYQIINGLILRLVNSVTSDRLGPRRASEIANEAALTSIREIEDLISYFYHGGSQYQTPFWKEIKAISRKRLRKSDWFRFSIEVARKARAKGKPFDNLGLVYPKTLVPTIDEVFEYDYLSDSPTWQNFLSERD